MVSSSHLFFSYFNVIVSLMFYFCIFFLYSQSCEAGRYSNIVGQDCIDCVGGQYRPSKIKGKTDDPTKCLNCEIGYTSKDGASTCDKCGEGSYGSEDGVCTDCPTGYYQDVKGELKCAACPIDTFLIESGKKSKADCLACPTERSTGTAVGNINSTACLCKRKDYYQDHDGNCLVCPDGADCSDHDGITLAELGTQPGYWRVNALSIDFADCARGFSSSTSPKNDSIKRCPGSKNQNKSFDATAQCRNIDGTEAYGGPACMACLDARYTMSGNKCVFCEGGGIFVSALIPMLCACVLLFLLVLLFTLVGGGGDKTDSDNKLPRTKSTRRLRKMKRMNKLFGQMKILLSLLQIVSSMPSVVTSIAFPKFFRETANLFGIFNLDVLRFSGLMSCNMSVRFFDRFLIHMMLPIGCALAITASYLVAHAVTAKSNTTKHTRINEAVSKVLILVILLLFPGLSTKVFQVWKCTTVYGMEGRYLVQDFNIQCNQGEHMSFSILAVGFLLLYIVGIPLTMFVLMFRNRKILHDESTCSPKHRAIKNALRGLYAQCKYCYFNSLSCKIFNLLTFLCDFSLPFNIPIQMNLSTGGLN